MVSCPAVRGEQTCAGQRANIAARVTARSNASTLLLRGCSASSSRLPRARRARSSPSRTTARQRGGELLRPAGVGEQRVAVLDGDVPGGADRGAAHHREAGGDRLAHDHAEGLEQRRQDEDVGGRVGGGKVLGGGVAGEADRDVEARRERAQFLIQRPAAGDVQLGLVRVRPARANASISPPTFLSGTSRATVRRRTGPSWLAGSAARIGSGVEGLEADLDGVGGGAEREEPLPRGAARRDETGRAAGEPAVEPQLGGGQPLLDPRRVLAEEHERDAAAGAPGPGAERGRPVLPGDDHRRAGSRSARSRPRGQTTGVPPLRSRWKARGGRRRRRAGRETTCAPDPNRPAAGLVDDAQRQRGARARPANSGSRYGTGAGGTTAQRIIAARVRAASPR